MYFHLNGLLTSPSFALSPLPPPHYPLPFTSLSPFFFLLSSKVFDVVRGMIEFTSMADMQKAVQALLDSDEITVLRLKNRFGTPTDGGWRDVMINFWINGDRNKHICEVRAYPTRSARPFRILSI